MWGNILGSIFAALFGRLLAWFKQNELEAAAALSEELRQYANSVQAANAAEEEVSTAMTAHIEAHAQVNELQEQLDAIKKWNQRHVRSKIAGKHLKRPTKKE